MNNQNTALTIQEDFLLPSMVNGTFSNDDLADDMDGIEVSFPKIKIPAGASIQFEIPTDDPENPDYSKTLEGVILFHHPNFAYWSAGKEYDETTPPLCTSVDGKLGIGEPGGICANCALNEFGSAAEGNGKACKNMRLIYLLCNGNFMPYQLSLPPTSLKPFSEFMRQAFILRRRASYGSVVQISLKKANNGSNDYSVAVFRRVLDFDGEKLEQVRAYADGFRKQMKLALELRAEANEAKQEDICLIDTDEANPIQHDNIDATLPVAQTINGEYGQLPA